ncbi:MAG: HmuY family protein [Saprospiraceae bacterium]
MNTSKSMLAANTFSSDFDNIVDDDGYSYHFDSPAGLRDSLAFRGWYDIMEDKPVSNDYVFLVDRGRDANGKSQGYKKIQIETVDETLYYIKYSDLDGSDLKFDTIVKDSVYNYICYSFDNGKVDIEPEKNDWTLVFTKYQTYYPTTDGYFLPYTVVGALQNPYNVKVVKDTKTDFDDIDLDFVNSVSFSDSLDIIGFDWKYYNFDQDNYSIVDTFKYIIHNNDQYYYKMRFLEFYDEEGRKGFPKFEYKRL